MQSIQRTKPTQEETFTAKKQRDLVQSSKPAKPIVVIKSADIHHEEESKEEAKAKKEGSRRGSQKSQAGIMKAQQPAQPTEGSQESANSDTTQSSSDKEAKPKHTSLGLLKAFEGLNIGPKEEEKKEAKTEAKAETKGRVMTFEDYFSSKKRKFFLIAAAKPEKLCKEGMLEAEDKSYLSKYWYDFYSYQKNEEKQGMLMDLFRNHPTIKPHLRIKFISWLYHTIACLRRSADETIFYQTVKMIDTYLAKAKTPQVDNDYALLGVSCYLMQSKVTEVDPINIESAKTNLCFNKFSHQQFVSMETQIMKTLEFQMSTVTSLDFLLIYAKMIQFYAQEHMKQNFTKEVVNALNFVETQARHFSRALLCDYTIQSVRPSVLGACSIIFGLFCAFRKADQGRNRHGFEHKELLVVQEAWRNICREVISFTTAEDLDTFMVELSQRVGYLREKAKVETEMLFPRGFEKFLPEFDEAWEFEDIL